MALLLALGMADTNETLNGFYRRFRMMIPVWHGETITFHYKNWRGVEGQRTVRPVYIWRGVTEWHKEEQWFLHAFDCQVEKMREFAMADMSRVQRC